MLRIFRGIDTYHCYVDRYSSEHFSIAISDAVLCFEMPFFALLHIYAFSYKDYMPSKTRTYSGRMPFMYALRDSIFGYKDILGDSLTTLRGSGFSYRTFEPAEGGLHSSTGDARARRAKAGLRYADGGKTKYWLPMPGADVEEAYGRHASRAAPLQSAGYTATDGSHHLRDILEHPVDATSTGAQIAHFLANPVQTIGRAIRERRDMDRGYAPIAPEQADEVVHQDTRYLLGQDAYSTAEARGLTAGVVPLASNLGVGGYGTGDSLHSGTSSVLEFGDLSDSEEEMYKESKQLEFGDYNYRKYITGNSCRAFGLIIGNYSIQLFSMLRRNKHAGRCGNWKMLSYKGALENGALLGRWTDEHGERTTPLKAPQRRTRRTKGKEKIPRGYRMGASISWWRTLKQKKRSIHLNEKGKSSIYIPAHFGCADVLAAHEQRRACFALTKNKESIQTDLWCNGH